MREERERLGCGQGELRELGQRVIRLGAAAAGEGGGWSWMRRGGGAAWMGWAEAEAVERAGGGAPEILPPGNRPPLLPSGRSPAQHRAPAPLTATCRSRALPSSSPSTLNQLAVQRRPEPPSHPPALVRILLCVPCLAAAADSQPHPLLPQSSSAPRSPPMLLTAFVKRLASRSPSPRVRLELFPVAQTPS